MQSSFSNLYPRPEEARVEAAIPGILQRAVEFPAGGSNLIGVWCELVVKTKVEEMPRAINAMLSNRIRSLVYTARPRH